MYTPAGGFLPYYSPPCASHEQALMSNHTCSDLHVREKRQQQTKKKIGFISRQKRERETAGDPPPSPCLEMPRGTRNDVWVVQEALTVHSDYVARDQDSRVS